VMPTTAARKLDVSAGGEAGIDWANIGSPTTAQNLSATNIDVDQVVASVSGNVATLAGAATVVLTDGSLTAAKIAADAITAAKIADGAIDAATFAAGAINAAALASDAITAAKIADGAIDAATFAAGAIDAAAIAANAITDAKVAADVTIASVTGAVGSVTGNVGGNVAGSVASIAAGGIASTSFAAGAIDNAAIAANAIGASEIAADAIDEIWDELIGDSTVTARQAMKAFMAALAGKLSGAATTTVSIRNVADDTNVIVATVDASGNRSAVTLTL
jgi:hypothetical protein